MCPFCEEVRFDLPVEPCESCQIRLNAIDRIVAEWNNSVMVNKMSVEVKINV